MAWKHCIAVTQQKAEDLFAQVTSTWGVLSLLSALDSSVEISEVYSFSLSSLFKLFFLFKLIYANLK